MFDINHIFLYGKHDYDKAKVVASKCSSFKLDVDEDELVTSIDFPTCYNCLFRRWSINSFQCMKSFTNV